MSEKKDVSERQDKETGGSNKDNSGTGCTERIEDISNTTAGCQNCISKGEIIIEKEDNTVCGAYLKYLEATEAAEKETPHPTPNTTLHSAVEEPSKAHASKKYAEVLATRAKEKDYANSGVDSEALKSKLKELSSEGKEKAEEDDATCIPDYDSKDRKISAVRFSYDADGEEIVVEVIPAPVDFASKPIVWVLGGPGSGKGTQCEKIIAKYGFTHLSTGDLLRAEVKSGSDRAKTLTAIMERGELVPNSIVLDLLKEAMAAKAESSNGFLIDGYPREESQGKEFEEAIAPVTVILYFEASVETLTKRLLGRAASSGRADDNEETIKLRLNTFLANNDKVLAQYPSKLVRINAERSVDEIFADVEKALDPLAKK